MTFSEAIRSCFAKYATFQGRAPRSEFWFFILFSVLGGFATGILDAVTFGVAQNDTEFFSALFSLAIFLPSIAVSVRRLHDIDRAGWWWLIVFVPIIGLILLLVWYCTGGDAGENKFGNDPLDRDPASRASGANHRSSIPKVPRQ